MGLIKTGLWEAVLYLHGLSEKRGIKRVGGTFWTILVEGPKGRVIGFEKGGQGPDAAVRHFRKHVAIPVQRWLVAVPTRIRSDYVPGHSVKAVSPGVWAYPPEQLKQKLG